MGSKWYDFVYFVEYDELQSLLIMDYEVLFWDLMW